MTTALTPEEREHPSSVLAPSGLTEERARRIVIRNAGAATANVLEALGLDPITEQEEAALVLERERVRSPESLPVERMPLLRPELAGPVQELIHLIATACGVGRRLATWPEKPEDN